MHATFRIKDGWLKVKGLNDSASSREKAALLLPGIESIVPFVVTGDPAVQLMRVAAYICCCATPLRTR